MHFWFQMTRACITWKTRGLDSRTCQTRSRFITRRSTYVIAARCTVKRVRSIDIYGTNAERRQTCRVRNAEKCLNTGITWRSIWRVAASKTWETLTFSRCSTSISLPVKIWEFLIFVIYLSRISSLLFHEINQKIWIFPIRFVFQRSFEHLFKKKTRTLRQIDSILLLHPFFLQILRFTLDIILETN